MAPKVKQNQAKAEKEKAKAKQAAKAKADPAQSLALDTKKEQQNFLNTLKYRAQSCNQTEAQQLLKDRGIYIYKYFYICLYVKKSYIYIYINDFF